VTKLHSHNLVTDQSVTKLHSHDLVTDQSVTKLHSHDLVTDQSVTKLHSHDLVTDQSVTKLHSHNLAPAQSKQLNKLGYEPKFHIANPTFQPKPAPPAAETWLRHARSTLEAVLSAPLPHSRMNITPEQHLFLRQLRTNSNIVIKPADKNLGLTILDRSTYDAEIERQLLDADTYRIITSAADIPTKNIYAQLTALFRSAEKAELIDKTIVKFISKKVNPFNAIVPLFYGLPKVHKPNLTCRPIVPGHSWITTPASTYLDHVIQPFAKQIPTITPDSTSIINALEQLHIEDPSCIMMTADVASLYTNIPTAEGVDLVDSFLLSHSTLSAEMRTFIIKVLRVVLTNNYFSFGDRFFLQLIGTAMGTPVAVVFANIFMYMLERTVLSAHRATVLFYRRFLDDIFAILTLRDHASFIHDLEHRHPSIKLDVKLSSSSVDFLDLRIFKGPRFDATGVLDFAVHQKQLNAYLYLPYRSFHIPRSKGGFMVTELMRYVRNSSSRSDYIAIKRLFYERLRARGYPAAFLRFFLSKVQYSDRARLLQRREAPTDPSTQPVFFTTEYNSLTHKLPLQRILRQHMTGGIALDLSIGFRRSHNLHNLLCSTTLHATPERVSDPSDPSSGPLNPINPLSSP
jgi:hypothetical protein